MIAPDLSKLAFWAKTTPDRKRPAGIDVFHHTRDVGNVAKLIAEARIEAAQRFSLTPSVVAVLTAFHDIGKISQGFQVKCDAWAGLNGIADIANTQGWRNLEPDHAKVSQFTVQHLLMESGMQRKHAIWWAVSVGAHHGYPHHPGERGLERAAGMSDDENATRDSEWERHRRHVAQKLVEELGELPGSEISRDSPVLWWLAGLISIADWIGSDEIKFPPDKNRDARESRVAAQDAVESIDLDRPILKQRLGFHDLFKFQPYDLQVQALEAIAEPGVYVIEAPMGMGKTEAALACAYRLMCEGKATGFYFALPTQTTSNRIHVRVQKFVDAICEETARTRLIHANSWLLENVRQPSPASTIGHDVSADARAARDWFASPKRALLAPFGVGTVDQALLSVVAAKHFFVRRFGLAGKVVILDEIHSYDFYTGTLIRVLCETLESLGCTVILLSATLTAERRAALLGQSKPKKDVCYPLISGRVSGGSLVTPRQAASPSEKTVKIRFVKPDEVVAKAWDRAQAGACVVWICNTVARAQNIYAQVRSAREQSADATRPEIGLLHSRFPHFKREPTEKYWMGALGKEGETEHKRPHGCILVSTQIVEQSVDLDADLLITDLAPTDMLLQRIGRLWRHKRGPRPERAAQCWILSETVTLEEFRSMDKKRILDELGTKARVYAPYVLLRSLEVWAARDGRAIRIPTQIRGLISKTYMDRSEESSDWERLKQDIQGDEFAKKKFAEMSTNIWQELLDDQEGVQTRVSTVETVQLILVVRVDGLRLSLLNGDHVDLSGEAFSIADARALHRNLVKVPKSEFAAFSNTAATSRYVKGEQAVALVSSGGRLQVSGMKEGRSLFWSDEFGVEIRRGTAGKDDHEPCD